MLGIILRQFFYIQAIHAICVVYDLLEIPIPVFFIQSDMRRGDIRLCKPVRFGVCVCVGNQLFADPVPTVCFCNEYARYPRKYIWERVEVGHHERCHCDDLPINCCDEHGFLIPKFPIVQQVQGMRFDLVPRKIRNKTDQIICKRRAFSTAWIESASIGDASLQKPKCCSTFFTVSSTQLFSVRSTQKKSLCLIA